MRPETDMEKIRAAAKTLLHLDIRPTSLSPMVVSHPFTNSGFVGLRDEDGSVRIGAITEDQEALASDALLKESLEDLKKAYEGSAAGE